MITVTPPRASTHETLCECCNLMDASVCSLTSPDVQDTANLVSSRLNAASIVANSREKLSVLDEAIARLQHCRQKIEDQIQEYKKTLRSLQDFPEDVLMIVFYHLLCPQKDFECESPWKLAAVCRQWRAIVLTSSSLWSVLSIRLNGKMFQPSLSLIAEQLTRSCSRPVRIEVQAAESLADEPPSLRAALAASVISVIGSVTTRCYAISFKGPVFHHVPIGSPPKLSSLEQVTITHTHDLWSVCRYLRDTPALDAVILERDIISVPSLPGSQTSTDLTIKNCTAPVQPLLILLTHHQNLVRLRLGDFYRTSEVGPSDLPTLVLPNLEEFIVSFDILWEDDEDEMEKHFYIHTSRIVVQHMRAPKLKMLRALRPCLSDFQAIMKSIISENFGGCLVDFELVDPGGFILGSFNCDTILRLLLHLPSLQKLVLSDYAPHADIGSLFQGLAHHAEEEDSLNAHSLEASREQLCPRLDSVTLSGIRAPLIALRDMVAMRLPLLTAKESGRNE